MDERIQRELANARALIIAWQLVSERKRIIEALTLSESENYWVKMEACKTIQDMILPFCRERICFSDDDIKERIRKMEPHPLLAGS